MTTPEDEIWRDDAAGPLVRPYTVSNGRTRPTIDLDLMSLVTATGRTMAAQMDPDHAAALVLCRAPIPVAEVAARLRLPMLVAKVLLSDLIDSGTLSTRMGGTHGDPATDPAVLEVLLDGLRQIL
jgi:hypothetical protein